MALHIAPDSRFGRFLKRRHQDPADHVPNASIRVDHLAGRPEYERLRVGF